MADTSGPNKRPAVIDLTGDDEDTSDNQPTKRRRITSPPSASTNPLVQAAATGQAQRLQRLLKHSQRGVAEAAMAAAKNGHLRCIFAIREHFCDPKDDEMHISFEGREILQRAVVPAAANGHVDMVEFMLRAMCEDGEQDCIAPWGAFKAAVANNRVEVVKNTADCLPTWEDDFEEKIGEVVNFAIGRGYLEVVGILMGWEEYQGDFGAAFEQAVVKKQHAVAEKIYEVYQQVSRGDNLFVEMAARGRTDTVTYMYEHGHSDAKLVGEAVRRATANKCTPVVEFLRGTGRASNARAF